MRIAILHSDHILLNAITRAGMQPELFLSNEDPTKLTTFAGFILLDDLSASYESILRQQSQLGKPVLGMGKGAEYLTKSGLIPGLENAAPCITCTDAEEVENTIRLTEHYQLNAFTRYLTLKNTLLTSATSRRFIVPGALAMEMQFLGTNLFQWGEKTESMAGIANKMGNVLALLPLLEESPSCDLIFQSMRDYIREGYVQQVAPLNYMHRN